MFKGLFEYLLYSIPLISFSACFIGVYFYQHLTGKSKLVLLYLFLCLIFDLIGRVMEFTHHNNLILVPIFGALELIVFSLIYHKFMLKWNKPLIVVNAVALLVVLTDSALLDPFELSSFHSVGRIVDGFFILILCISCFYYFMIDEASATRSIVWFNAITFLFFTINFLWFLVVNFLINAMGESIFYLWVINIIATPLFYLYLTFYLWKNRIQPTS